MYSQHTGSWHGGRNTLAVSLIFAGSNLFAGHLADILSPVQRNEWNFVMKLVIFLSKLKQSALLVLALFLCGVVGVVDALNGSAYSIVPFYLVPVVLAAWFLGRKTGYFLSCMSALSWLVAEMVSRHYYKFDLAMYWNDFMELML